MDLLETEDHFVLRADLPGMSEEDVNIELEDNVLTLSGERKAEHEEKREGFYRVERAFGAFSRSLTLPRGIDAEASTAAFDKRRARGADPEAGAAQAAQDRDLRGRRAADARGRGHLSGPANPLQDDREPAAPAGSPRRRARAAFLTRLVAPSFSIRTRDPGRAPAPARCSCPRRGPHAGLRPARHQGGGEDARGRRGRPTSATTWCSPTRSTCSSRPGRS